jgi:hypothetical protein
MAWAEITSPVSREISKIARVSLLPRKIIPDIHDDGLVNNPQGFKREGEGDRFFSS